MKNPQTIPLLTTVVPALIAAPPILIGLAIGVGLIWLASDEKKPASPMQPGQAENPAAAPATEPEISAAPPPARNLPRRISREDVAEALAFGERAVHRTEAVAALQALGYQKSAAYKALTLQGRFADRLRHSRDGLIEWIG